MGEVIQLQGDQRKDVQEFLTDKKEGLELDAKTIKVCNSSSTCHRTSADPCPRTGPWFLSPSSPAPPVIIQSELRQKFVCRLRVLFQLLAHLASSVDDWVDVVVFTARFDMGRSSMIPAFFTERNDGMGRSTRNGYLLSLLLHWNLFLALSTGAKMCN
jgi:hypothetical protein